MESGHLGPHPPRCYHTAKATNSGDEPEVKSQKFDIVVFTEEEDFTSILRDRSHIDETLRLAAEEKAGDYAGEVMRQNYYTIVLSIYTIFCLFLKKKHISS